ncbi:MAG: ABC transporter ATP-binding protein [Eubacterium sp.]|nr:ABC transporter ATP-binding protein [Eubacterium sp.]
MSVIMIDHVTKSFGKVEVLKEFNDEFRDGEFITLLGPSGCGKTTMLRMIAGFERPTTGEIRIDGAVVSGRDTFLPPEKRGIGMVFQSYAVWPHMNVYKNTDGVLDEQRPDGERFEKQRLAEVLNANRDLDCKDLIRKVQTAVLDFGGTEGQFDDITMLELIYKG